jgi:hypothetical protein
MLCSGQSSLLAANDSQRIAFYLLIACEFCTSRRAVHGVRSPAKGLLLFAARLGSLIAITPEMGHLFPLIKGMASLLAGDERTGDFGILRTRYDLAGAAPGDLIVA